MRITCIIPAYNEANRIAEVLKVALDHPSLSEIIMVDDGSTDGTAEQALKASALYGHFQLIRHETNRGKSSAIATGIEEATGDLLLFLDSDLKGLGLQEISALIKPVTEGDADVALSLRRNAPRLWHWLGVDYISGERIMPRSLLSAHTETIRNLRGFGLEVFLNTLWIQQNLRLSVVEWPAVKSTPKWQKLGWLRGALADVNMLADMFATVGPTVALRQIKALRSQRISPRRRFAH
jgi:GT2 family glycosyltransferase